MPKPRTFGILAAFATLALTPAVAASPTPPRVGVANFDQLAQPLPKPYDEAADANRAVATAKARALRSGKRLLIDLGGNWCADCRILAGVMALPAVRAFVERHYALVMVDVGQFDRNLQIPAHYGLKGRLEGVPSLLVIDPRTDRLLNRGHTAALADARHLSPQALADWLARWAG